MYLLVPHILPDGETQLFLQLRVLCLMTELAHCIDEELLAHRHDDNSNIGKESGQSPVGAPVFGQVGKIQCWTTYLHWACE